MPNTGTWLPGTAWNSAWVLAASGRDASDAYTNARVRRLLAGARMALARQQCMTFRKIAAHAAARQVIGHHAHASQFAQVLAA